MFIIGKVISDGETNFTQYNKLQKISAKNRAKCESANGIIYSSIKPDRYSSSKLIKKT